jgi:signal transduction histidine kinase/ActR/RegA family two-component response regulator
MSSRKVITAAIVVFSISFGLFVLFYERHTFNQAKTHIKDHARIIANALWDYNSQGASEYLLLACQSHNYESLRVTEINGKVFEEVRVKKPEGIDGLFISLGLIRSRQLVSDVVFKKETIGQIEAAWTSKTIYMHIYALFALVLLTFVIYLYMRNLHAKQSLEVRVQERTMELKNSNVTLKQEITERILAEKEQKRLETQLLQASKMEAVGTLAGGISHDFNNLLQAIMGYTQLLLLDKTKEDPEFFQLEQIEKSAQRGSELTRRLLTFSRNVESNKRPLNLNNEINRTHTILKSTIPRMIEMELILEDDLKHVNADPIQMEQILMNLAVNSRDAMPDGGRLVFETKNVVLDEEYFKTHPTAMPGEYVLLTIVDTGFGMNKETIEHIYEPFFTTKEVGKGTGLGLAMVYGIVENHGGHITIVSKPDQGTTFRIYFPVLKAYVEREASERKEEKLQGGSETILMVDDEETVRDIAKSMLGRVGYTAITAESGEEAVEIFKRSNPYPDLIILDIGMPGMGGHKCLKELRKIYPDIKVIVASGYPETGKVEKTIKAGAAGFIAKPYLIAEMLKKVREVLNNGKTKTQIFEGINRRKNG